MGMWYNPASPPLMPPQTRYLAGALLTGTLLAAGLLPATPLPAAPDREAFHYTKIVLSDLFQAEGGAFGDLNRDGHPDAIAGPYWYEGPDFSRRHELYPPKTFDQKRYSDNFCVFIHDFNRDGWNDILIVGFPGKAAFWLENPAGSDGPWTKHHAFEPVDNESPTFGDLLGNGQPVLMCSKGGQLGYATPNAAAPNEPWTFRPISTPGPRQRFTHGLGFGDVNGDGRADMLEATGWWEQPPAGSGDALWQRHELNLGRGGSQMHVHDVNGDGRPDIVTALHAHGYGLSWFEQLKPTESGPAFQEHPILPNHPVAPGTSLQFTQLHAVALCDVDGDGKTDIVTGKRWWAHGPDEDPEAGGIPVLYAFLRRDGPDGIRFEPHLIDDASGVGVHMATADVNADGRPDILIVNKRGAFVFLSGPAR